MSHSYCPDCGRCNMGGCDGTMCGGKCTCTDEVRLALWNDFVRMCHEEGYVRGAHRAGIVAWAQMYIRKGHSKRGRPPNPPKPPDREWA